MTKNTLTNIEKENIIKFGASEFIIHERAFAPEIKSFDGFEYFKGKIVLDSANGKKFGDSFFFAKKDNHWAYGSTITQARDSLVAKMLVMYQKFIKEAEQEKIQKTR